MGLAERLGPVPSQTGECGTCHWYGKLDDAEKLAFDGWVLGGGSVAALWAACAAKYDHDGAPIANPLPRKLTQFKDCVRRHLRPQIREELHGLG